MKNILIIFLIMIFAISANSQNTILTNEAYIINTSAFKIEKEKGLFWYKNKKNRIKSLQIEEVFSVVDSTGKETIFYQQDETDNLFSINEMRSYLTGKGDSKLKYRNNLDFWAGFGVGVGGSAGLSFVLPVSPVIYPLIPLAFDTWSVSRDVKESKILPYLSNEQKENVYYKKGFQEGAYKKKLKKTLLGSGVGLVVGFAIMFIVAT